MSKAIIIYDTRSGNTKLLAEKIMKRLEDLEVSVEIYRDKEFKSIDSIKDFEIIGLGTPTHAGQMARTFKKFLKKVNQLNLQGKKLIVFGTGADPNSPPKICNDIKEMVSPTGLQVIAEIGCVKKPTDDINKEIENSIQKDMF